MHSPSANCDSVSLNEPDVSLSNVHRTDSFQQAKKEILFPPVQCVSNPFEDAETKLSCASSSPDAGIMCTLSLSSTSCSTKPAEISHGNSTTFGTPTHQSSCPSIAFPKHSYSSKSNFTPLRSVKDRCILHNGYKYAPIDESVLSRLQKPLFRMIVSESENRCLSCHIQSRKDRCCFVLTPVVVLSPAKKKGFYKKMILTGKRWLVFLFQRVNEKSLKETTQVAQLLVPSIL